MEQNIEVLKQMRAELVQRIVALDAAINKMQCELQYLPPDSIDSVMLNEINATGGRNDE